MAFAYEISAVGNNQCFLTAPTPPVKHPRRAALGRAWICNHPILAGNYSNEAVRKGP